jgi:hypothetical protein
VSTLSRPVYWNTTTFELTYGSATQNVVTQAAGTTALTTSMRGQTIVITSGTTQNFTTTGLGSGDAGFFVYVKNGTNSGVSVQSGGGVMPGITATLFYATNINTSIQIVYWGGSSLTMY